MFNTNDKDYSEHFQAQSVQLFLNSLPRRDFKKSDYWVKKYEHFYDVRPQIQIATWFLKGLNQFTL